MIDKNLVLQALTELTADGRFSKTVVINSIKEGLIKAYQKTTSPEAIVQVDINESTGDIDMARMMTVVEQVVNPATEITVEAAAKIANDPKIGQEVAIPISPDSFTRLAAFQVRQILKQRLQEVENAEIYNQYADKVGEILTGVVEHVEPHKVLFLKLGKATVFIPQKNQIPNEQYRPGDHIQFYVEDVLKAHKLGNILGSRTNNRFLYALLKLEVPEVTQGIVEIKAISRIPGNRAKVAVYSHDETINPIGACVGVRGARILKISEILNNEKIDLVLWDDDLATFILNAVAPAKVICIYRDLKNRRIQLIVPDNDAAVAIGKQGTAVKLIAWLVRQNVNIIPFTTAVEQKMPIYWNGNLPGDMVKILQSVLIKTNRPLVFDIPVEVEVNLPSKAMDFEPEIKLEPTDQASPTPLATDSDQSSSTTETDESPAAEATEPTPTSEPKPDVEGAAAESESSANLDDQEPTDKLDSASSSSTNEPDDQAE